MSSYPRPKIKVANLRQVTPDTNFYIDYSWWDEENRDLRTYLLTGHSVSVDLGQDLHAERVDLIDSRTGEVRQVDAFQYLVQSYFRRQDDSLIGHGSIVDAVFTVLLANGNEPMSIAEIAERVRRPTDLLVKTFGGSQIYQGIRPIFDDE